MMLAGIDGGRLGLGARAKGIKKIEAEVRTIAIVLGAV